MRLLACFLALLVPLSAVPAAAQTLVYEVVEVQVEQAPADTGSAYRYVSPQLARAEASAIAQYGPFIVLDDATAALVDVTDTATPERFAAMMRAHPDLRTLRFIEAPGTFDDRANLRLGRMIRSHGLATHVPEGGSVRSGAVELFLAGSRRLVDDEAEFAVHAWLDEAGYSAQDYPADSPEHRKYLAYYAEMGMSAETARRFYAMTNSVPFEDARWLDGVEMRRWLGQTADEDGAGGKVLRLAHLDTPLLLQ